MAVLPKPYLIQKSDPTALGSEAPTPELKQLKIAVLGVSKFGVFRMIEVRGEDSGTGGKVAPRSTKS